MIAPCMLQDHEARAREALAIDGVALSVATNRRPDAQATSSWPAARGNSPVRRTRPGRTDGFVSEKMDEGGSKVRFVRKL